MPARLFLLQHQGLNELFVSTVQPARRGQVVPLYRVHLNGRNFHVQMEANIERWGFYTFRDVAADDPVNAEYLAVQMLREKQELRQMVKNPIDDPPMIHLEDVLEIDEPNPNQCGLIWYPERIAIPWWQFWNKRYATRA